MQGRLVVEQLRRAVLVDVTDEAAVHAVTDELAQARLEAPDLLDRDAQLLVLLLADVTGAVVHGDADAALAGPVRTAPVPEAAVPDEHAALGHLCRDAVIGTEDVGGVVPQVRAGDEPGGAVGLGEVGQRPHGVEYGGRVGLREGDDLVVGVDRLSALAGTDVDRRERRHQAPGVQDPVDDGQHVGVNGYPLVQGTVHEEVVDAQRLGSLELVGRRLDLELAYQAIEIVDQGVDHVGLDGVLDDRVADLGDPLHVAGDGGGFHDPVPPRVTTLVKLLPRSVPSPGRVAPRW